MDTTSVEDTPVTRELAGATVSFPRLGLDDIEHYGDELKVKHAATNQVLATKNKLDNWQQYRADQEFEHAGISVPEVFRYLRTTTGLKSAYKRICEAAKFSPEDATRYAKLLGPLGQLELVADCLSAPPSPPQNRPNSGPLVPNE